MVVVLGVEFMTAVTAPFYCQLCSSFSSNISEAEWHLRSSDHNRKYKVCATVVIYFLLYEDAGLPG